MGFALLLNAVCLVIKEAVCTLRAFLTLGLIKTCAASCFEPSIKTHQGIAGKDFQQSGNLSAVTAG